MRFPCRHKALFFGTRKTFHPDATAFIPSTTFISKENTLPRHERRRKIDSGPPRMKQVKK